MYEAFFGLRNRPFSPLPRVETYIPLAPVREPFEALVRCVTQEQGIGVLTAPSGAGKSLVCRLLQKRFSDERRTILLTTARFPTRRALLQAILFELKHPFIGLSEQEARLRVLDLLQASPAPQNRMLLIVDEAHLLSVRGLEELRTLADYEITETPCVSLILSGQLELEELLTSPEMNALNQRVGCHACIEPLTFEESTRYLSERLRCAGNDGLTIFTPEAIQLICSASEGNPRRLNQLSDHSMLLAYAEETRPVDVSIVRAALLDLRELPLHWNAPLDLTWTAERNPLEEFADSQALKPLDDSFTDCDAEFDIDEVAAFETCDDDHPVNTEASVFEVGTPFDSASLEQLFEVTQFVVPGDPAPTTDLPSWCSTDGTSLAADSYAYETAPPAGVYTDNTASELEAKDDTMDMESLSTSGFHHDMALSVSDTPKTSASSMEFASRSEFEELVVDDAYAMLDRQLESSIPRQNPPILEKALVEVSNAPVSESEEACEDRDETLSEAAPTDVPQESPADFDLNITEVHPMLDESQLLDFINEISVDVRRFRKATESSGARADLAEPSVTSGEESARPRHQSLRQSLNWQFDVVEPDSTEPLHSTVNVDSQGEASLAFEPERHETPESTSPSVASSVAPSIEAATQSSHSAERPYAQLFTRLQRLRRRVDSVMKRERSTESEARLGG